MIIIYRINGLKKQNKTNGCVLAKYMFWSDCQLIHFQIILGKNK